MQKNQHQERVVTKIKIIKEELQFEEIFEKIDNQLK